MQAPASLALGMLAGGQATRLGGRDKAWLVRDGIAQVVRLARQFAPHCSEVWVSANRNLPRYAEHGLHAVADRVAQIGPMGGLDVLANACTTEWLLTVSVDVLQLPDTLLPRLAQAGGQGAVACDDDGLQPLVALYRVDALRPALAAALAAQQHSVRQMQALLELPHVQFSGMYFGNINTPEDLRQAGCSDADSAASGG
jgi:molybdopterin-guanine dinucleotide biosynthesis protein A